MNQRSAPFVTVLMSCYDAAEWLEVSVLSILNQTYRNFEFLIIDDGSKDATLSILEKFANKDFRIKIIKKENSGLADSLNIGLGFARGEWIARMDADDISEKNRLETQVAYVLNHPDVVYVGSNLTLIDRTGNYIANHKYPTAHNSLLNNLLVSKPFPPHSSAFYLCVLARELGGYRRNILRAEDWDLWLRLSEKGCLSNISEPLVRIRKHADQISLSGGGRDSLIDSRISIVSYLLRNSNFLDPVNLNENDFKKLHSLIAQSLQEEGYFEYFDWKIQLKKNLKKSFYKTVFFYIFTKPQFMIWLIYERFFGHRFGKNFIKLKMSQGYINFVDNNSR